MKKLLLLLATLTGLAPAALAQHAVSGKIVDRQTQQPIPYASVGVLGTPFGTTSNAEGEFVVNVPQLPGRLVVSQLSYGRDTVAVAAAGVLRVVALAPAPVQLPNVEPTSYAAELLKKAYRELQRSNASKQYGQAFYRQVTRLDQRPTEVQEMLWQAKASSAGLDGTVLTQVRYAKKKDALLSMKNLSSFTRDFHLYSPQADTSRASGILSPDPLARYTLRLVGVTQAGNQSLAEIAFVGRPEFNQHHVDGSVVVDLDTYQVLRFRGGMDVSGSSNNPLLKFKNARMTYDVTYRPLPTGAIPDHMTTTYSVTVGRMLRADMQEVASGFTYFYNWQPTPTNLPYAKATSQDSDIDARKLAYDPAYWRDNPVVKRTPLEDEIIQSFEQEKAFGTLLDK